MAEIEGDNPSSHGALARELIPGDKVTFMALLALGTLAASPFPSL